MARTKRPGPYMRRCSRKRHREARRRDQWRRVRDTNRTVRALDGADDVERRPSSRRWVVVAAVAAERASYRRFGWIPDLSSPPLPRFGWAARTSGRPEFERRASLAASRYRLSFCRFSARAATALSPDALAIARFAAAKGGGARLQDLTMRVASRRTVARSQPRGQNCGLKVSRMTSAGIRLRSAWGAWPDRTPPHRQGG